MQELRKLWKLHTKLLAENRVTKPINDRKVAKASGLKIGQLVFIKNIIRVLFTPHILFNHRVLAIVNESTVVLTTPDGRIKRCHIHHIKPMSASESSVSAFQHFGMVFPRNQLAYSKVTCIICMQETINCSMALYAQVSNFSNFILGIN